MMVILFIIQLSFVSLFGASSQLVRLYSVVACCSWKLSGWADETEVKL